MIKTYYSDLDISFTMDNASVRALNIIFERFTRTIPAHSHGSNCYEIHYIPFGYGKMHAEGKYYEITPNTLYVTGPRIEHAQAPVPQDPMQEYCVYLQIKSPSKKKAASPLLDIFCATPFWIGQDSQGIHTLMQQLFFELEHRYIGSSQQIELLLSQLLISMVRNYQGKQKHRQNLQSQQPDKKSVIIEEYFLYEYQSLSLKNLSERLSLSPRQTQRLLITYYNKSFQEKKTEARMSAAAILLGDEERSISSIADALGYSSLEHFSTSFRRYYGKSPREYRKTIL